MIYLFCGDDIKNKHKTYEELIKSGLSASEIFRIDKNSFNRAEMENFYSGSGLFFKKCLVVLTNVFERSENLDFILEKISSLADSPNTFIFLEGKLNKPVLESFKKAGAEVKVFDQPKIKKERYNNFLLADAFGKKDRLHLWIYFRQAIDNGAGLEELAGILFWKAKDLILKRDFKEFKESELKNFAGRISYLLPEARRNGLEAEYALERFLLETF